MSSREIREVLTAVLGVLAVAFFALVVGWGCWPIAAVLMAITAP